MSDQVVRIQQFTKGSLQKIGEEVEREKDDGIEHRNEDIDNQRTENNYFYKHTKNGMYQDFKQMCKDLNIKNEVKKKATAFEGMVITSDHEFFENMGYLEQGKPTRTTKQFFDRAYNWAVKQIGFQGTDANILSAAVHYDEKTPHLQIYYVPVVDSWREKVLERDDNGKICRNQNGSPIQKRDENGKLVYKDVKDSDDRKISRDAFWKNRGGKNSYSRMQDNFYDHVSLIWDLGRGQKGSTREHTTKAQYAAKENEKILVENEKLTAENNDLSAKNEQYKNDKKAYESKIEELTGQKTELEQQKMALEQQNETLEQQKMALEQQNSELKEQKTGLAQQNETLVEQNNVLQAEYNKQLDRKMSVKKFFSHIIGKDDEPITLHHDDAEYVREIIAGKRESENIAEQKAELEQKKAEQEKEKKKLENDKNQLEQDRENQQNIVEKLVKERLEEEKKKLEREKSKEIKDLEQTNERLQNAIWENLQISQRKDDFMKSIQFKNGISIYDHWTAAEQLRENAKNQQNRSYDDFER